MSKTVLSDVEKIDLVNKNFTEIYRLTRAAAHLHGSATDNDYVSAAVWLNGRLRAGGRTTLQNPNPGFETPGDFKDLLVQMQHEIDASVPPEKRGIVKLLIAAIRRRSEANPFSESPMGKPSLQVISTPRDP